MYEMLCSYVGLLENASNFSTNMLAELDVELKACSRDDGSAKKGLYFKNIINICTIVPNIACQD